MRIAVLGGTGTAGRAVVREAQRRGHSVRVVSRREHRPESRGDSTDGLEYAVADLAIGNGVTDALREIDVAIDCTQPRNTSGKGLQAHFVDGTRRLLAAEVEAGVHRHVVLSIVGIDAVPYRYYRAKLAQERTARAGSVPVSVVRATQFHDFAGQMAQRLGIGPLAVIPSMRLQPVETAEVARVLLDASESPQPIPLWQIAGPQEENLVDLTRAWLRAQRRRVVVIPIPLPGPMGRAVRAGAGLLPDGPTGGRDATSWLAALADQTLG